MISKAFYFRIVFKATVQKPEAMAMTIFWIYGLQSTHYLRTAT